MLTSPPPLTPDRAVQVPSPTESGPLHGPGTNGSCGQLNVKSDALQAQALEILRSTGCPTGASESSSFLRQTSDQQLGELPKASRGCNHGT